MKNYQKINNIVGWATFLIAAFVYIMTIEPTASFWDCGEFIATAYKLEVGHPPGAPLFQMMARFMILFAGGDLTKVPVMVNILSALASAFAILFLFWSITALAKKLVAPKGNVTNAQLIAIMGSGLVGALAYTFSDSFWFSAVEGEVYASSSFFTAIVFWAILKWETVAEEKHASRWIILIAYLMGLSIGVHLLNLLCIPAVAFVYYFKKYTPTVKGFIVTSILSLVILGTIQAGIIPGIVSTMAKFDLFFVNTLGMGFGSGVVVFFIVLVGGIVAGLIYTKKKQKPIWNTVILCFTFILIGYSSFGLIVIRSQANPPMDENNPENVFTLLSYLNREQYGDRPLLSGQYYTAKYIDQEYGDMTYGKGKDKYVETGKRPIPIYDPKDCTIFPRMYSNQASHVSAYKQWAGVVGDKKPTFGQNLKFFFSYQVNFMYWRYFMWNFVGRQNDIQGDGNLKEGNWISGIGFLDQLIGNVGPQDKLPESMTNNKAMNKFYFLPFIIGLIGLFYQYKKSKEDTFIVFLLFLLTGMAIVIYLNQTPFQPRERDYAYAGSFYAFAIWIGLGVLGIIEFLQKKLDAKTSGIIATVVCLLGAPVLMAKDGWDDHDRSGRFTARDFAHDYLNSCAPNAILFTNGDNDTFPLWYAQEVEGIRTDVRVCNLSLLNTDWYIDQMKRKAYDSEPIPYTLGNDKFFGETRNYVPFYDQKMTEPVNLKDLIDFIGSDDPQAKLPTQGGEQLNYFPTKNFRLSVDSAAVLANGTVSKDMASKIVKNIDWTVDKNYLMKADIAILDLLASNNWKRPIYFAITVGADSYLGLEDYFQLEGLAYRLVPIKNNRMSDGQTGRVENKAMYDNLMNKFKWGGMNNPKVYLDENNLRMTMNFRNNFARLAESLLNDGKKDSAMAVLNKSLEVMPDKTVPFNVFSLRIAEMYYRIALEDGAITNDSLGVQKQDTELTGRDKKAIEAGTALVKRLADIYENDLQYYLSLNGKYAKSVDRDLQQGMAVMQELLRLAKEGKQTKLEKDLEARFAKLQTLYSQSGRGN